MFPPKNSIEYFPILINLVGFFLNSAPVGLEVGQNIFNAVQHTNDLISVGEPVRGAITPVSNRKIKLTVE